MDAAGELFEAIAERNVGHAKRLLDEHPRLATARGPDGISAIMAARYFGHPQILELLLRAAGSLDIFESAAVGDVAALSAALQADPAAAALFSPDGYTPLHLAAFFGNEDCALQLLERRAPVGAVSRNHMALQPLHSAAAGGHVSVAGMLIQHGADVNSRQHGGWTALHAAAQHGDAALCDLLLRSGADPGIRNDGGTVAAELVPSGRDELVELLLTRWLGEREASAGAGVPPDVEEA